MVYLSAALACGYPQGARAGFEALQGYSDIRMIGNYRGCLSWSRVTGSWIPEEGTDPAAGRKTIGERAIEPEIKIEVIVRDENLESVMKEIIKVHPYEEPLINVIRLETP